MLRARFTYIPPRTEDRALMFDTEIRGQMAMLMGGRAAEELTCMQARLPPPVCCPCQLLSSAQRQLCQGSMCTQVLPPCCPCKIVTVCTASRVVLWQC